MNTKIGFYKYIFICALGFGLGGLLWGWVLYSELPDLEFPFHYLAIIIMGLFGGVSLAWPLKDWKKTVKAVLVGWLGWFVGFFLAPFLVYYLSIIGVTLLSVITPSFLIDKGFLELKPDISITAYWLVFLIIGAIIGLFYALFLKVKAWPLIWRGGLGFALGSLFAPVFGNIIGNLFDSLLISYLITFALIGVSLGKSLAWGVYKFKI
ncbi:MAG: hypothetical protein ABIJ60_03005 [Patescibacteria group bacterium]